MADKIFSTTLHETIQTILMEHLNSMDLDELGFNYSVRAAGDKFPKLLSKKFREIIEKEMFQFEDTQGRKKICNFRFYNSELNYYIDVITHREDTKLNMPNITSINRLLKILKNNKNHFCILLINYSLLKNNNPISSVKFFPIEWLDWGSITFGNLGNGQIQIKDTSKILLNKNVERLNWLIDFCDKTKQWYNYQNNKNIKRIENIDEFKKFLSNNERQQ